MNTLDAAFNQADYRVALDRRWLTLRIGAPCPAGLARWIGHRAGRTPAWLITACNPHSERLAESRNAARNAVLRQWARAHACAVLDTVNRDPAGHWPDEPGLLLAGIEEGLAHVLARRFGQLAMVAVPVDAPVALIWLEAGATAQRSE